MHARARVVGDIDEVSHNKRAGKNETIMIMRRERYERLLVGIVRNPTRVFFRVTPHAARVSEHRLKHWTSQAEFCVKVNGAHKSAYNKIAPARICLLAPKGSELGGGRNRAPSARIGWRI